MLIATSCVPLHAEQTKLKPWFILGSNQWLNKVVSNAVVFFYSLGSPSLYTLCCFSFSQMVIAVCFSSTSDSSLADGGPWYFTDVYACVCVFVCGSVSTPVHFSTDLFLDLQAGLSDEERSWNIAAGFITPQALQAWSMYMHLFIDVLLSLTTSIPFLSIKSRTQQACIY